MFLGLKEESVAETVKRPALYWVVLVFIIIALLITIGKVFGSLGGDGGTTEEGQESSPSLLQTLFNAKVLGAVVLLIISVFAIQNITKKVVE